MHRLKRRMLWINLAGGSAVLASYGHGLWTHAATRTDVWGGVPEAIRPLYVVSMLLAAAGYFLFTYFVFFRVDPAHARVARRLGFNLFNLLYGMILVPSVLWMPLTFAMLEQPSAALWYTIRLTLAIVGVGSLGLVAALLSLRPRDAGRAYWLAVAGSVAFAVQTALLDALVWPAFFAA